MPRFAANLSFLYQDLSFLDRIDAAACDGFEGVESMFPDGIDPAAFRDRVDGHGLRVALVNAPAGDWAAGERGLASLDGREADFRDSIERALAYAAAIGSPRVHVLAGLLPEGGDRAAAIARYEERLHWAAGQGERGGIALTIEPINPFDMPGYLLQRQDEAHAIVERLGAPSLKVQMDLYHCARVEGDVVAQLRRWLPTGRVGHLQIAGVPDRHEPDEGTLDWRDALAAIDAIAAATGWDGWVGAEYRPRRGAEPGGTGAGLDWLRRWRADQAIARTSPSP
ncbi:TIM barrel protein [Mitsuaria sp. GD03876]|uniref:hydroxypyruvate isomerase family protein n=1 Tax=Mitsuaria sp. GD03876 TaxID=2975399 RepID=UPI00244CAEB1|nr:TIM barrel protein [Mitsuaria sp. GD03876]MDH0868266.1 TIM barrel protein [Mitsuaria sp. GD03876]